MNYINNELQEKLFKKYQEISWTKYQSLPSLQEKLQKKYFNI